MIVLDVKSGSGSFMKTADDARELAENLTAVGKLAGKKTVAVITDMDEPLGNAVGNALEVKEAIEVLHGEKKGELLELCLTLGACILTEAGIAENDAAARKMLEKGIEDGSALESLPSLSRDRRVTDARCSIPRFCPWRLFSLRPCATAQAM